MTLFGFSNQKGGMGSSLGWAKGLKELKVQVLNPGKGENANITINIQTSAIKKKGILIMETG